MLQKLQMKVDPYLTIFNFENQKLAAIAYSHSLKKLYVFPLCVIVFFRHQGELHFVCSWFHSLRLT